MVRPVHLDLRAGLREGDGAPCLVAAAGGEDTARIIPFETSGLRLARYRDDGGTLIVLTLEEPARRDLFARVCDDVVAAILAAEDAGETDLLGGFAERLAAWRTFLRDQTGGLARSELVGLLGELLVLERLRNASGNALSAWTAPDDGLHDLQRDGRAVEVKTSLGAARRFTASSLDQFDEAGLAALHVAHVRLTERPDGDTLDDVVQRIEGMMPSARERQAFRNALLRRGLVPGAADGNNLRVLCQRIDYYSVASAFPRLTRLTVPAGIEDARYDIDVAILAPFRVDEEAVLMGMGAGHDG